MALENGTLSLFKLSHWNRLHTGWYALADDNVGQTTSNIPQDCYGIGIYIGRLKWRYIRCIWSGNNRNYNTTFDVGDVLGWAV